MNAIAKIDSEIKSIESTIATLLRERDELAAKLVEVRKICLSVDTMIANDRKKWIGSLEWLTGQIMCAAKFGPGYEQSDLKKP